MSSAVQQFEIYLQDEIPKFRSGRRTIEVLQIGPKWVKLQCGRKRATVRRSVWVELIKANAAFQRRSGNLAG